MVKVEKNRSFVLKGVAIAPGQRGIVALEVARLYTHSPLEIPIEIVNGAKPGPVLLINAALHGDELNGVEVVRQVLASVNPARLRGTLVAVPVVNVFGFIHKSRYLPDRRDLNRSFPGSESGSIAARMAHLYFNEVVRHCTHIIDLHTGPIYRTNLPQVRARLASTENARMAKAFGAPIIIDSALREGSLRAEAERASIPVLTYEAGEALRFEPLAIAGGARGVIRVMRELGMLRASRKERLSQATIAYASGWIRAEQDGIVRSRVSLGARVATEQILAYISPPLGNAEWAVKAPRDGIIIGQQTLPLVNEGDAIFHLAYFEPPADGVQGQATGDREKVMDAGNFAGVEID